MSDYHQYLASDLQLSLERAEESYRQAERGRQYLLIKCDDLEKELQHYKNIAERLAKVVYDAGCYTYPTYLDYQKLVGNND